MSFAHWRGTVVAGMRAFHSAKLPPFDAVQSQPAHDYYLLTRQHGSERHPSTTSPKNARKRGRHFQCPDQKMRRRREINKTWAGWKIPNGGILYLLSFLFPLASSFCHAWTRCTTTPQRHQPAAPISKLFVASYPLSSNNFSSSRMNDAEESSSSSTRGKRRGKPQRHRQRTKPEIRPDQKKFEKRPSAQSRPSRPAFVSSDRANGAKKHQSSKAAYQFNRALQSILETPDKRPPTLEAVKEAQEMMLIRVHNKKSKIGGKKTMVESASASFVKEDPDVDAFDTVSFNIVMQAWARQHSMEAAQAADDLLRLLWRKTSLKADSYSYSAVLHAYAKAGGGRPAALRATELLAEYLNLPTAENVSRSSRTDVCHNAVMDAWAVSGDNRAGERAEQILRQLLEDPRRSATRVSYNACIKAYAKSGQPKEAQRILDRMRSLAKAGEVGVAPDKVSITTCMHAWAMSTKDLSLAADRADALLREMEETFQEIRNEDIRPDIVAYSSVLDVTAKSGGSPSKPLELLKRMERFGKERPNAKFLNTWIHLLAKTNETETAASSAEAILEHMKAESAAGNHELTPCVVTYTAVITCLAQVRSVASAKRAEALLEELVDLWMSTGDDSYLPNAKTFASVLNSWSKSGIEDGIQRAEVLLNRMEHLYNMTQKDELRPNLIVYMQVFQILARSRSPMAGRKAQEVLQEMNRLYLEGHADVRPDATTMAYFLNTLTKSGVSNAVELASHIVNEVEEGYNAGMGHLKPTSLLYSAALQAYAKSASAKGAELAESLLERTRLLYREGKLYAKPNVLFYNAVMDAHARSNGGLHAAERAEALLDEMESRSRAGDASLQPTTRSYNAAILAWKNSDVVDAPIRAETLLKRMNERYKAGDHNCRPDRVTLNSIIAVWAKSTDPLGPQRAADFLQFMESLYRKGEEQFRPDQYTFNTCIDAYARRGDGRGAHKLFERMQELALSDPSLAPSRITLTSLRAAWNKSNKEEAAQHLPTIQALLTDRAGGNE